ncbi:hypothetical protein ACLB2K_012353 [Fragaria x ananassa]
MGFNKFFFGLCILAVIFGSHVSEARTKGHHSHRDHSHRDRSHQDPPHRESIDKHNKVPPQVPTPIPPRQEPTPQNKVPPKVPASLNPNQDFLDEHNKARAEVGVGPMKWNDTLAAYAQDYANKKIENCEMVHSEGPYGECLAEGYGDMTGAEATKFWVTEKENYDYASNTCTKDECGHYTQVVWRNSTDLGCAKAHCKNGWVFVICSYYPPGNYVDEKPY